MYDQSKTDAILQALEKVLNIGDVTHKGSKI